jgi:SRSO17 transposase
VGKSANCQVSVELVVSEGWVAAPITAQLYLPQGWSEDARRRAEARVPAEVAFRTKPELALALIRQAHADGATALR